MPREADQIRAEEFPSDIHWFREIFQRVEKDGRLYSKCVIKGCHRMLAGTQKSNLERHLSSIHNIQLENTPATATSICRLCFTEKANLINVFAPELDIVNTIELHFPVSEVSNDDLLPKVVCSQCWNKLSEFHEFYVAVNKSTMTYLANFVAIEESNLSDSNIESIGSGAADILGADVETIIKMEQNDDDNDAEPFLLHRIDETIKSEDWGSSMNPLDDYEEEKVENISEPIMDDPSKNNFLLNQQQENRPARYTDVLDGSFELLTRNGKTYSKCLIEGCNRILTGQYKSNLRRHLKLHRESQPIPQRYAESINKNFEHVTRSGKEYFKCKIDDCNQLLSGKCKINLSDHLKLHLENRLNESFELVTRNGKEYCKCKIDDCNRLLSGKNKVNLTQHLKLHQENRPIPRRYAESINKNFELVTRNGKEYFKCKIGDCNRLLSAKCKINLSVHLKMHQENRLNANFELVTRNSKEYFKCKIDDCNRYLSGNHKSDLAKHLKLHQANRPIPGRFTELVNKSFELGTRNGKTYSKCLIEGCNLILSGQNHSSLGRHLKQHEENRSPTNCKIDK